MDGAVPTDVDRELLQVTAAAFRRQHKIIAVLFDIVLLPVTGLVAGNQHKRRVAGSIFQPGRRSLLNERVVEPQRFAIRDKNAFIWLGHMPVKQVRTFYPQVALSVLDGVTAAVGDFLREAGMEAAHFIKTAF